MTLGTWPTTRRPTPRDLAYLADKPSNLATGWYVAIASHDLRRAPRRVPLLGAQHVAWRGADGVAHVQSATCPHMGAALFDGAVVDNSLECPFHRWRYDADGVCVFVPGRTPPTRARVAMLPTREASGYVWVWYGPGLPSHEPPELPSLSGRRRQRRHRFALADTTRTTPRRILENTWDPDHLVALHGLTVTGATEVTFQETEVGEDGRSERLDADFRWPSYSGALGAVSDLLGLNARTFTLRVRGWASCQHIEYFTDDVRVYEMVLATTPVAQNLSVQHIRVAVDHDVRVLGPLRTLVHRAEVSVAAKQDLPIFDTLVPGDRHGIYMPTDATLRRFRRFYQTWVDDVGAAA